VATITKIKKKTKKIKKERKVVKVASIMAKSYTTHPLTKILMGRTNKKEISRKIKRLKMVNRVRAETITPSMNKMKRRAKREVRGKILRIVKKVNPSHQRKTSQEEKTSETKLMMMRSNKDMAKAEALEAKSGPEVVVDMETTEEVENIREAREVLCTTTENKEQIWDLAAKT